MASNQDLMANSSQKTKSSKHTPAPVTPGITPYCQSKLETIHAINGTSIIWPAAHEAAKIPSTRLRFSTNQRVATEAANPQPSMLLASPNNVPIEKTDAIFRTQMWSTQDLLLIMHKKLRQFLSIQGAA